MKKGIPRKEKHGLKTRKGGPCKDKSIKGSTEEWRFRRGQSCNQDDILKDSKMLTSGSL